MTKTTPEDVLKKSSIEISLQLIQLETERDEASAAKSRAHTFLRNVAIDLEEGKDPTWVADNIHDALGDGRPNKTEEEDDE